jgi:hypothetical protein
VWREENEFNRAKRNIPLGGSAEAERGASGCLENEK